MPDKLDRCVRHIKEDPPSDWRDWADTLEEAAFRICNAAIKALNTNTSGAANVTYSEDEDEEEEEKRVVKGWASVEIPDLENDEISVEGVFKSIERYYARRNPKLMLQHSSVDVGEITALKLREKENGKIGVWVEARVYDDTSIDDEVWDAIKSGEIRGFSIKGRAPKKEKKCDENGLCWNFYPDFELLEISAVDQPANPEAVMEEVNLKAKKDSDSPCLEVIRGIISECKEKGFMSDSDDLTEKQDEEEEEEPEPEPEEEEAEEEEDEEMEESKDLEARLETLEGMVKDLSEALTRLGPGTQDAAAEAAEAAEEVADTAAETDKEGAYDDDDEDEEDEEKSAESDVDVENELQRKIEALEKRLEDLGAQPDSHRQGKTVTDRNTPDGAVSIEKLIEKHASGPRFDREAFFAEFGIKA